MKTKQVIVIRRDLHMRRGKEIAQASHAACAFLSRAVMERDFRLKEVEIEWLQSSYRKIACQVDTKEELEALIDEARRLGVSVWPIVDQGLTEFKEPTLTCAAFGPDYDYRLEFTRGLRLY